jgi:hypothetical protein
MKPIRAKIGGGRGTGFEPSPRGPARRKVTQRTAPAIPCQQAWPDRSRKLGSLPALREAKTQPAAGLAQRVPASLLLRPRSSNPSEFSPLREPSGSPGDRLSGENGKPGNAHNLSIPGRVRCMTLSTKSDSNDHSMAAKSRSGADGRPDGCARCTSEQTDQGAGPFIPPSSPLVSARRLRRFVPPRLQ